MSLKYTFQELPLIENFIISRLNVETDSSGYSRSEVFNREVAFCELAGVSYIVKKNTTIHGAKSETHEFVSRMHNRR